MNDGMLPVKALVVYKDNRVRRVKLSILLDDGILLLPVKALPEDDNRKQ